MSGYIPPFPLYAFMACIRASLLFRRFSQNCEKGLLTSLCLSVRPSVRPSAWNNLERILIKFDTSVFFKNFSRNLKFY